MLAAGVFDALRGTGKVSVLALAAMQARYDPREGYMRDYLDVLEAGGEPVLLPATTAFFLNNVGPWVKEQPGYKASSDSAASASSRGGSNEEEGAEGQQTTKTKAKPKPESLAAGGVNLH